LIGIVAFFALMSIFSSLGKSTSSSGAAASGTECAASYPDKQPSDVCADGTGTVNISGLAVTATPLALSGDGMGGSALCSDVTIKNASDSSQDYNELDFKLQTPTGDVGTANMMSIGSTINSGTLVAGGIKTGKLCSDSSAAIQHGQYVLIYKPNPFEETRGIWLSSE
jgi:hypothetical protein